MEKNREAKIERYIKQGGTWVRLERKDMRIMTMQQTSMIDGDHLYVDKDGIRLVYEAQKGKSQFQLVGWYRPDGWDKDARIKYSTKNELLAAEERDRNDPFC